MLGEQLYPYSFHGSSFPRIVMLPNVCPAPGRMQREPVRWRERRPMCFLQSFRRMSRADLQAFFCRMLAEVGLAPEARYREQPGGVRRVDQVALRRLALDLQDCPFFFFLHRTRPTCGESQKCFFFLSWTFGNAFCKCLHCFPVKRKHSRTSGIIVFNIEHTHGRLC